jgi:hypothetical protein
VVLVKDQLESHARIAIHITFCPATGDTRVPFHKSEEAVAAAAFVLGNGALPPGQLELLDAAIEEFLRAEGFSEQRTNVVSDTQKVERRLVGRWSEIS